MPARGTRVRRAPLTADSPKWPTSLPNNGHPARVPPIAIGLIIIDVMPHPGGEKQIRMMCYTRKVTQRRSTFSLYGFVHL